MQPGERLGLRDTSHRLIDAFAAMRLNEMTRAWLQREEEPRGLNPRAS